MSHSLAIIKPFACCLILSSHHIPSQMLRPAILLSSTLAAFASVHALRIISRTTLPSNAHVSSSDIISESFANSLAVAIVNPYRHATVNDTRSTIIAVPLSLSHEQILARFVTGFFAGHVFAPERGALRLLRKQLVDFKSKQALVPLLLHRV